MDYGQKDERAMPRGWKRTSESKALEKRTIMTVAREEDTAKYEHAAAVIRQVVEQIERTGSKEQDNEDIGQRNKN